jgi:hypothetical protein
VVTRRLGKGGATLNPFVRWLDDMGSTKPQRTKRCRNPANPAEQANASGDRGSAERTSPRSGGIQAIQLRAAKQARRRGGQAKPPLGEAKRFRSGI